MNKKISFHDSIYVAGHNGMAGGAICRSLRKFGYKNIINASKRELDLKDQQKVRKWFKSNKPDVVILAANKVVEPSEKYGLVTFSVWVILSIPSVESNDMFPPAIAIYLSPNLNS